MDKTFVVGDEVAFFYHGKQRLVEVTRVNEEYITGKNINPMEAETYKSFSISKIENPVKVKK